MATSLSAESHPRWSTAAVVVLALVGMPVWVEALIWAFGALPPVEALSFLGFVGSLLATPITVVVVGGTAIVCWAPVSGRKRLAAALIAAATVVARAALAIIFS